MDRLWRDVRFGWRTLFKDPGFLVTAVIALGLGIGSTTAIFSVIDNVLLEPFPYTDGQRLMAIQIRDTASHDEYGREGFSQPEFLDYQEQNHIFDRVIGTRADRVLMTNPDGSAESFDGASVTGNTFEFLGMRPLIGRAATPADAKPGAPPVFVMSYKLWQRRFAGDPSIVGKAYVLNNKPTTLIGIMPQRFNWWGKELWTPVSLNRAETDPNAPWFFMLGH